MQPWVVAWLLGTVSGLTLPLGAILGIIFTPVRSEVCAAWMAFGAGALLFAVTIELYGHTLRELEHGKVGIVEVFATIGGALVGALFYLVVNRWLEEFMDAAEVEDNSDSEAWSDVGSAQAALPLVAEQPATETSPLLATKSRRVSHSCAVTMPDNMSRRAFSSFSAGDSASLSGVSGVSRRKSLMGTPTFLGDREAPRSRGRTSILNAMSQTGALSPFARIDDTSQTKPPQGMQSAFSAIPESPRSDSPAQDDEKDKDADGQGAKVGFALFMGILVDGVPEGLLMGFLAAEDHLSMVLILSLLVANFPEAFSSASLMSEAGVSKAKILSMWGGLCILVGALAGGSCFALKYFFPTYPDGDNLPHALIFSIAIIEGITGGAMITCIATVMLPEAFERAGKGGWLCASSGFLCTAGFLVAVMMKALEHYYNHHYGQSPELVGHSLHLRGTGW